MNRLARLYAFLACFSLANFGCSGGPAVGDVAGKVTLGGSPFGEGQARILFRESSTGGAAVAELKPDGTFQVVTPEGGIPLGKYDVAIQPPPPAPIEPSDAAKGITAPADTSKIPPIYRDFKTSGLKATVAAGKNNFDFEMKPQ